MMLLQLFPDSGLADSLTTALFNMSIAEGMELLNMYPDTEAVWVKGIKSPFLLALSYTLYNEILD